VHVVEMTTPRPVELPSVRRRFPNGSHRGIAVSFPITTPASRMLVSRISRGATWLISPMVRSARFRSRHQLRSLHARCGKKKYDSSSRNVAECRGVLGGLCDRGAPAMVSARVQAELADFPIFAPNCRADFGGRD